MSLKILFLLGWLALNVIFIGLGVGFGFLLRLIFPIDWGQAILIGCISVFATYYAIYNLISDSATFVDVNDYDEDDDDDYVSEIKAKVYSSVKNNASQDLFRKRKSSRK